MSWPTPYFGPQTRPRLSFTSFRNTNEGTSGPPRTACGPPSLHPDSGLGPDSFHSSRPCSCPHLDEGPLLTPHRSHGAHACRTGAWPPSRQPVSPDSSHMLGGENGVQHTLRPGPRAMVLHPRLKDQVAGRLRPPTAPLAPGRIWEAPQHPRGQVAEPSSPGLRAFPARSAASHAGATSSQMGLPRVKDTALTARPGEPPSAEAQGLGFPMRRPPPSCPRCPGRPGLQPAWTPHR